MRHPRGQTLAEFALILPILLLILMGIFDFGRAIVAYNTLSEAARNGARVSIVNQKSADICSVAAGRAVAISLPTACALTPTAVGIYVTGCTDLKCEQTVRATYQFQAITPIIGTIIGPITMTASSTVLVESTCVTGPCPTT